MRVALIGSDTIDHDDLVEGREQQPDALVFGEAMTPPQGVAVS